MSDPKFINMHQHSHYSINDSICKVPQIVKRAIELGQNAVCLTDHGTLGGLAELWQECKKNNVKPILGLEGYYVDDYNNVESKISYNYSHIILIAKNEQGWKNLKLIQSKAWEEGHLKKPRICWEYIKKYKEGLICTTACLRGLVGWNYLRSSDKGEWEFNDTDNEKTERIKIVHERISKFLDLFGEDFYLELHLNEIAVQARLNKFILNNCKNWGSKLIAANDCHYINRQDYKLHDIMVAHFHKKLLTDSDAGLYSEGTTQLDMKNYQGMKLCWEAYHDDYMSEEQFNKSIFNTMQLSEKVEQFHIHPKTVCLPKFADDPRLEMMKWTEEGYKIKLTKEQQESKEYKERLQYEYNIFDKLNMHSYMLVCADIIRRAKQNRIPVGPGRGSVCGSLVAFCMHITEIDPIRFNTMFDRFLIASRLSLPDIDMDFGKAGRDKIKEKVRELYGEEKFAAIVTYGDWKPRGLIKDIGKVLGRSFDEMNQVTKKVHDKTKKFEDEEYPMNPEVMSWLEENPEILKPALKLEGTYRARGVHASGMILTPTKLEDWVPVSYMIDRASEEKKPIKVSEWDMYYLEDFQILKMDFLGLQTLDVINHCVNLINKRIKDPIKNIWHTCLNDLENPEVYKTLQAGNLIGVFQMETSDGMHELVKRMQPHRFHDIVMAISLYRTAVIQAGMLEEFLKRREGEEYDYIHPCMKQVLESTLGILVFQEQLMEIAVVAAGFTRQESDNFRKATKLKDIEKFKPFKDQFVAGCKKKGLSEEEADEVWNWCYKFAGYGFSINHAVAYGLITYVTVWLKTFYPTEYMVSLMSYNVGDEEMMPKYLTECKKLNVKIINPDINKSTNKFKLTKKGYILHPLTSLKGIGDNALKYIIDERKNGKFTSLQDFYDRINKTKVNVNIMSKLILSGSFRFINGKVEDSFDEFISWRSKDNSFRQMYCRVCKLRFPCVIKKSESEQSFCPSCASSNLYFDDEQCAGKKFSESYISSQVFGFSFGGNVLKQFVNQISKHKAEPLSCLEELEDNERAVVAVFVRNIKKWRDKKDREMAFIDISDGELSCSMVVFAQDWESIKKDITVGCCYIIKANKNKGTNLLYSSWSKSKIIRLGM